MSEIYLGSSSGWVELGGGIEGSGGGLAWKGAWNSAGIYVEADVVSYQGVLYVAPGDMVVGQLPPDDPSALMFNHSASVSGSQSFSRITANEVKNWSYTSFAGSGVETEAKHWYFDVDTAGTVSFDLTMLTGTNTYLRVVNSANTNVAQTVDGSDTSATLSVGRYYLRIGYFTSAPASGTIKLVPGTAVIAPIPLTDPLLWTRMVGGQVQTPYILAAYTKDRSFDPETAAVLEIARALATLIDDLKAAGVIKP